MNGAASVELGSNGTITARGCDGRCQPEVDIGFEWSEPLFFDTSGERENLLQMRRAAHRDGNAVLRQGSTRDVEASV